MIFLYFIFISIGKKFKLGFLIYVGIIFVIATHLERNTPRNSEHGVAFSIGRSSLRSLIRVGGPHHLPLKAGKY